MDQDDIQRENTAATQDEEQTLLLLTPFTTTAPVAGGNLVDYLQESSPYKPFAEYLQSFSKNIASTAWGGIIPAITVLQGGLENVSSLNYRSRRTGKILPSISHSMVEYIAAFKFYDILVRMESAERTSRDVLKQPQQKGYLGDQKHMNGISNLRTLVEDVIKAGDSYTQLATVQTSQQNASGSSNQASSSEIRNPNPLYAIARELNDASEAKGVLKIIRNLSAVALSIRILMQGTCLSIPDEYATFVQRLPTASQPQTAAQHGDLSAAVADPRGLRQAFYLSTLISPLLAVVAGRELQKYPVCFEEILVNSKRIGNDKPLPIVKVEDQVMVELLRIAEGSQTSTTAFLNLYYTWKQQPPEFTLEENTFFDRPQSMEKSKVTKTVSIFQTHASPPYPKDPEWPLSQRGWKYVRSEGSESALPTASSMSGDFAGVPSPAPERHPSGKTSSENGQEQVPREGEDVNRSAAEDEPSDDIDSLDDQQTENGPGLSKDGRSKSPRRSNRGRKDRPTPPNPSGTQSRPKVSRPSKKRPRESGDGGVEAIVVDVRQVHRTSGKKRQEIMDESLAKMEGVEPPLFSEVQEGTAPLNVDETVSRYSDNEVYMFDVWDAEGTKETLRLESHLKGNFDIWKTIIEAIKDQHCPSGRPRFLDDPDNSVLRIFPKAEYSSRSADLVQRAFAKQCLLVPRFAHRESASSFDLEGLEEACDVNHKTAVQDFSAPECNDLNDCVRLGSLKDLYVTSIAPDHKRKSLNALYFPQSNERIDPQDPIGSDSRAWYRTKAEPHCPAQLPTADMRWHIVGTTGASHYFHVDPRGDGTYILVRVGLKAWVLAVPIDESVLFSAELWTKLEQDITKLDFTKWKLEMILLRPGDLLLQWPHISHAVYTPLHAICKGGHFIATATLRRTLLGMIHTFFCSGITNIDHPTFTARINSFVCFLYKTLTAEESPSPADAAHLPDIYSVSGLMDVLLLACVVEVQNALCPLSYTPTDDPSLSALLAKHHHSPMLALIDFDVSAMSHEMRVQNVYSRGRMQMLLRHIFDTKVTVCKTDGEEMRDPWGQLFIPMLAWLINGLKAYLNLAIANSRQHKVAIIKKRAPDHEASTSTSTPTLAKDSTCNIANIRALFNVQMRSSALRWEPLTNAVKKTPVGHKRGSGGITSLIPPDIHLSFTVAKKVASPIRQTAAGSDRGPPPNFRELGTRTLDSIYFVKYSQLLNSEAAEPSTNGKRPRLGTT